MASVRATEAFAFGSSDQNGAIQHTIAALVLAILRAENLVGCSFG
jgi:hypothetical protein